MFITSQGSATNPFAGSKVREEAINIRFPEA
jgi:hypothetical protein